jgi:hypothetical protein
MRPDCTDTGGHFISEIQRLSWRRFLFDLSYLSSFDSFQPFLWTHLKSTDFRERLTAFLYFEPPPYYYNRLSFDLLRSLERFACIFVAY